MLVPSTSHIPLAVSPGDDIDIQLEDVVSVPLLMMCMVHVRNTGAEDVRIRFIKTISLGPGPDPLTSGDYTSVIVDHVLSGGSLLSISVPASMVIASNSLELHTLNVNSDVANTVVNNIQVLITGVYDEALSDPPRANNRTILI